MLLLRVGFFKSDSMSMKGNFMKLNLEFKFSSSVFVYYLFCIVLAFKQFKLGRGGHVKTQLNFTQFIMMMTCFGCCGPSSGHKITGKTICNVQTY